ncbi:uncharacterized protein EI97DRAFT_439234 [Westerdykella ornata]|uniref:BTB domain-containing protein n=1 Tax=Westerdykella ornata TaxID=318751 RepID=A0A6A6JWQ9_WESOR|nr:uncharacterized protein EI97DRAFT_439234 [Westerdykella ornata]KAF2280176.1 hypothetical protein EI97DRAFT_439234 [Westerdykella ornata]
MSVKYVLSTQPSGRTMSLASSIRTYGKPLSATLPTTSFEARSPFQLNAPLSFVESSRDINGPTDSTPAPSLVMADGDPKLRLPAEDAEPALTGYSSDSSSSSYETISADAYPPLAAGPVHTTPSTPRSRLISADDSGNARPIDYWEDDSGGRGRTTTRAWEGGEDLEPFWTFDSLQGLSAPISRMPLIYDLLTPSHSSPTAKYIPGIPRPIEVTVGDSTSNAHRVFYISASLLASHSEFFAFIPANANPTSHTRVHLPELSPVHFANFVSYIHSNVYSVRAPDADPIIYNTAAWILGDQLRADKYRDSAMRALHCIFERTVKMQWSTEHDPQTQNGTVELITPTHIDYLCNATMTDCPLRTLFFDALAACWPHQRIRSILAVRMSYGPDKEWFELYRKFPECRSAIMSTFEVRDPGRRMILKEPVVYLDPTGKTWPPHLVEHARQVERKRPGSDARKRRELLKKIMRGENGPDRMWEDKPWKGLEKQTDEQMREPEPEPMATEPVNDTPQFSSNGKDVCDNPMEIDTQSDGWTKAETEETGQDLPDRPKKKRAKFLPRSFTSSKLRQYSFTTNDQDDGDVADDEWE